MTKQELSVVDNLYICAVSQADKGISNKFSAANNIDTGSDPPEFVWFNTIWKTTNCKSSYSYASNCYKWTKDNFIERSRTNIITQCSKCC